jgi:biotin-(acetyl-CoA carboxylase) ligase
VVEGLAEDIDQTGALILKMASGKRTTVLSGDCEHLRDLEFF